MTYVTREAWTGVRSTGGSDGNLGSSRRNTCRSGVRLYHFHLVVLLANCWRLLEAVGGCWRLLETVDAH
jgi:hypothetical protein